MDKKMFNFMATILVGLWIILIIGLCIFITYKLDINNKTHEFKDNEEAQRIYNEHKDNLSSPPYVYDKNALYYVIE